MSNRPMHWPKVVEVSFDGVTEARTLLLLARTALDRQTMDRTVRPRVRRFALRAMARLATAIDNARERA